MNSIKDDIDLKAATTSQLKSELADCKYHLRECIERPTDYSDHWERRTTGQLIVALNADISAIKEEMERRK